MNKTKDLTRMLGATVLLLSGLVLSAQIPPAGKVFHTASATVFMRLASDDLPGGQWAQLKTRFQAKEKLLSKKGDVYPLVPGATKAEKEEPYALYLTNNTTAIFTLYQDTSTKDKKVLEKDWPTWMVTARAANNKVTFKVEGSKNAPGWKVEAHEDLLAIKN